MSIYTTPVLFFAAGALLSAALTWVLVRRRLPFGQDKPDLLRKAHGTVIPRVGGLPIFLTLALGTLYLVASDRLPLVEWWPLLLCNVLIFGLGFVDDLYPLGAKIKLLGQLGVALIAFSLDLTIESLSNPFGEGTIQLNSLSLPLTLMWFVAITNIVNLIDGMDGLASGLGLFLCICLAAVGFMAGKIEVTLFALLMGGALLGFLFFNFPPAKIFLGDGGAYLLGFFIASVSMQTSNKGTVAAALLVVMIALGLPILDTAFAIVRRGIRGIPIFRADGEHIHHKLLMMGYSKHSALFILYGVVLVLCVIGISVFLSKGLTLPIIVVAAFLFSLAAARHLGYVESWSQLRGQLRNALGRRKEVQYAILHERILEADLVRCKTAEQFWKRFDYTLETLEMARHEHGGYTRIEIPYNHGRFKWVLYTAPSENNEQDWRAIAECLLPVYLKAEERWNTQKVSPSTQPPPSS